MSLARYLLFGAYWRRWWLMEGPYDSICSRIGSWFRLFEGTCLPLRLWMILLSQATQTAQLLWWICHFLDGIQGLKRKNPCTLYGVVHSHLLSGRHMSCSGHWSFPEADAFSLVRSKCCYIPMLSVLGCCWTSRYYVLTCVLWNVDITLLSAFTRITKRGNLWIIWR